VTLLGDDLTKSLKNLIIDAGRANGEGSSVTPGSVKNASGILKELLIKRTAELKGLDKPKHCAK
jgi:hypothetical protein